MKKTTDWNTGELTDWPTPAGSDDTEQKQLQPASKTYKPVHGGYPSKTKEVK